MITKLRHWWQEMQSSFWFLPAVMVLDAVVLATLLIILDASVDLQVVERWPLLFGAGAAGARGLLTAVASSMVTVAGVVFSITIVALSLTSSQYTSRVLRNFMRDRVNQVVLGIFVGIFAYCLVVLRTIRGGDEGAFIPPLAVLTGLILAFVGIAVLIYFIHHISKSIQASFIIATAAQETLAAVDQLFSQELGESAEEDTDGYLVKSFAEQAWSAVPARKTGYIESIDSDALLNLARKYQTIVRMEHGIGEFIVEGTSLISVAKRGGVDDATTDELNGVYVIGRQRVVEQDAAFGIRQIVDIAMKALSPGVNDTTTAVICVDYLTAILARLATRRITASHWMDDQRELRVMARGPSFESLLNEAFDQIRQNAESNVAILLRMLGSLQTIAVLTSSLNRRWLLQQKVEEIAEAAERTIVSPHDRVRFERRLARVREALETGPVLSMHEKPLYMTKK
ncbi:DUF2254 domain-containing protein [Candidatus Contendibacter odensensis]|uniref:DUF2254 domain-containing protein n=1 Tax=Candidatus Contendobacter odensis Run_B_J11 TaxID=1400861 RepID=A0A7U7GBP1_9GAMM|nr:DUF2254 domain-containing protein [Candidatus Contendobacter odensis]CDH45198.1 conserved membrane hypothetical protein [Candidatus Contendobacter odensis Run_B_J11]